MLSNYCVDTKTAKGKAAVLLAVVYNFMFVHTRLYKSCNCNSYLKFIVMYGMQPFVTFVLHDWKEVSRLLITVYLKGYC